MSKDLNELDELRSEHTESAEEELQEGHDYYMDGPYLVFTAAYHLKRGYCCASRCRHCPYGNAPTPAA